MNPAAAQPVVERASQQESRRNDNRHRYRQPAERGRYDAPDHREHHQPLVRVGRASEQERGAEEADEQNQVAQGHNQEPERRFDITGVSW